MPTPEPAGVYVHVPFCSAICPYCDFAVTVGDAAARRRLVEAVSTEAAAAGPAFGRPVDTVYFGGGTPSLLESDELERILAALGAHLELEPRRRIFLEANPEDVDRGRLEAWRRLGVTTLSLGVQALDEAALSFLGRRHSVGEALQAIESARAAGLATVSIDLIYARPSQTVDAWRAELDRAVASGVDHLSCYQLTLEPGTPFGRRAARGELAPPPPDVEADLLLATHEHLAALGFDGYEVSNFASAAEHRSRHNQKYWRRTPYLGLGPSAHSFAGERRWWNVRDSRCYVARVEAGESPVEAEEALTPAQQALESLLLGLRCREGVDLGELAQRTGIEVRRLNDRRLASWEESGWVELAADRLLPTTAGMALAERLAVELALEPALRAG